MSKPRSNCIPRKFVSTAQCVALVLLGILPLISPQLAFAANGVTVIANPFTINLCGSGNASSISATTTANNAVFSSGTNNPSGYDTTLLLIGAVNGAGTATE